MNNWNIHIDARSDHLSDDQIHDLLELIKPYSGALSIATGQGVPGYSASFDVQGSLIEYAVPRGINLFRDWAATLDVGPKFQIVAVEARIIDGEA